MDRDELRSVQRPVKDRYREDATSAVVTLQAAGLLAPADLACSVQTGRALVEAGLHPATGGDGTLACSGDMLLQALVACAGVTICAVAMSRGIALQGRVRAEGDLDFRGTLGTDPDAPVGFAAIRLMFELQADTDAVDDLIVTTERHCVVLQTLTKGVPVTLTLV